MITQKTVTLRRTQIEVPAPRNGWPGYRWTTGYYVVDPNTGNEIHPPIGRFEAYRMARELGATRVRVID
jgi:hypothetical protein